MSNNVEIRGPEDAKKTAKLMAMEEVRKASPRTVNGGEPIAYAEMTGPDKAYAKARNPAKVNAGSMKPQKDPAPQKFTKGNDNYTEVPFFQHTIKDN